MPPRFSFPRTNPSRRDVAALRETLRRLGIDVSPEETATNELENGSRRAVEEFQRRENLPRTGMVDAETLARINARLEHRFFADDKTRTRRVHEMLARLGLRVDEDEVKRRAFGPTTEAAIREFQERAGLTADGQLTEDLAGRLVEAAVRRRFTTKTQIGQLQRLLLRANRIAKVETNVDSSELKEKSLGASTKAAIEAFQRKYGLRPTGEIDVATFERLESVAASRPVPMKTLKAKAATELKPLKRVLRLNMANQHVGELQEILAFLGYKIDQKEFNAKKFGPTTRNAVIAYQTKTNLPVTGHVEEATLRSLNLELKKANPEAFSQAYPYRIRGSVRDELWKGRTSVKVQIWEKPLRGAGTLLAERPTLANGFYDIPYEPPRNPADNKIKSPFHLQIKVVDANGTQLDSKVLFNPTLIAWVNFVQGTEPYLGNSEFEERMRAVTKVLGTVPITSVVETEQTQEVTHLAINAGLTPDDVMRLIVAHRAAADLNNPTIGAAVFYAYLRQNLPPSLPSDLLDATEEWTLIDQLIDRTVSEVIFMDADLQAEAFDNALTLNLIPRPVGQQRDAILAALAAARRTFVLEKPLLIGNGSFGALLQASQVPVQHHAAMADAFLEHQSLGSEFWKDVKARAADFGGEAAVADLETTVMVGQIAKNHLPTLQFLKGRIADPNVPTITSARDFAKLSHADWVQLIQQNGGAVPDGTDGATPAEKINVYAATLAAQSEQLFPSIAFVAEVGRSNQHQLTKVTQVQQLLDAQPDLDLANTNIDKFVVDKQIAVAEEVLGEARVIQRVHRIAPTASLGRALLDKRIHSSAQIVSMGKQRLIESLQSAGVDEKASRTVYATAELQYARALMRLADFRAELHRDDPRAIIEHTYTPEEQQQLLGAIPNLETLFGSLDFCDCEHCESVIGPAAYLTDVLRFLGSHPSTQPNRTVLQVLFDRRPDIGNIKLNCENTETPLPYIDLVCEVLENAIPAPGPNSDFSFQTTRSAAELRAFPENVRKEAYDLLRAANFPMDSAFDLWQEEARTFLQHLGVPRWELMETFQARPSGGNPNPSDVSIAGEFWGISSHETGIIITPAATQADQDTFWGFDSTRDTIPVSEILDHTRLEYRELLELLYVRWLNPPNAPDMITIERPVDTASLDAQMVTPLSFAKLDQIHRFLRLWRHTPWKMWELDLLLRAPEVGNGSLDGDALVRLKQFRQVQEKLRLGVEEALGFYGAINTENRPRPDDPQRITPAIYERLFQNPAVTNPVNPAFALPLGPNLKLSDHVGTLLAALALSEADLARLLTRLGSDDLTLANLTFLVNYALLARAMRLRLEELLMLLDLAEIADPFATPKATLDFLETYERVRASGLAIRELDYLLTFRPDSPFGLREEVITQQIQALRESLRTTAPENKQGQIVAQVASTFLIPEERMKLLLEKLDLNGPLLGHLEDPKLTERDAQDQYTTPITPANFPRLYETYRLLHKATMLINRHAIDDSDLLDWLLTNHQTLGVLNLNALPVTAPPANSLFGAWLALRRALDFRASFPEPEDASFTGIVDLAANPAAAVDDVLTPLATLTTWKLADLQALHTGLQLQHGANSDYTKVDTFARLAKCFAAVKRIGVDAEQLVQWARRDVEANEAQFNTALLVRQAAKSKHDQVAWLTISTPIQDELRERKRKALVRYLVEHSLRTEPKTIGFNGQQYANPKRWKDADDLLGYFLIDVEMSACQLTSRIKQAISSVQMFVQRCFLNLEQPFVEVSQEELQDTASLNSWKQWKWMKSYRIWEANRKVFLYPENWIEPELRDDKSPFFVDLENELAQNDITDEHAETAFRHYLEKVHEVAHLEVVGIYHEVDDDSPYDNLPPNINQLHVVGRTKSDPATYYYRRYDLNYNTWTAWEQIEVDISGDHVVPVVYNRKLHLFWLVFLEKPQKVKKQPPATISTTNEPKDTPEPPTQLEIQVAWSVRQEKGWTPKRQSRQKLIHPWQRPLYSYHLKPRYKSQENQLWLDIYISTSVPFNNTRFYDPYVDALNYATAFRYDETARPWHSSSFIFDGEIVSVRLKPIAGKYRVMLGNGTLSDTPIDSNSYLYVRDAFGEVGAAIRPMTGPYQVAPSLVLPEGMHFQYTRLTNNTRVPNSSRLNVIERGKTRTLLTGARAPFEAVLSPHEIQYEVAEATPIIYQDAQRAFFARTQMETLYLGYNATLQRLRYTFYPFYHPYTALFLRELSRSGLDGLLTRKIQIAPHTFYPGNNFFFSQYSPASGVVASPSAVRDVVDFSPEGAYSIYNWEIFFHAPLMVACRLTQNQRFEEAMRWFHYIFDPTNTEAIGVPKRFWVTRPFYDQNSDDYRKQRIEKLLENIDAEIDQLKAWKNNPFKPHLIARNRPVAYQKAVVMKYLDNLIAWGDQLFRRDTIESINEATTLYVLAYELLGRRPVEVPDIERQDRSYNELVADGNLDPFGNKKVEVLMENFVNSPVRVVRSNDGVEPLPLLEVFYFSIPRNDKLLEYWNTVEDRLFKIRNCMNIEGVVRQLPLFEPPIDPALLVKAAAAGVDLDSVLSALGPPQTEYRFRVLVQKAVEFCAEVKALGDKLLAVLEKRDAEGLALLHSVNEVSMLQAVKAVRKSQIDEAMHAQSGLEKGKELAEAKREYYSSREFMNPWEITAMALGGVSALAETAIAVGYALAGGLAFIPRFTVGASGFGGSPVASADPVDGLKFSKAAEAAVQTLGAISRSAEKLGGLASTMGSYRRRQDEWTFSADLAEIEIEQYEKQIDAAAVRVAIAEKELENHELQIANAEAVDEYMRSKYTNQQLYNWMLSQVATVYFQSYQLAFDMAKRAEQAFRFELGKPDASFIQFGYWDSLKKGLLSGERLGNDIRRMEAAYFDQNTRSLELVKHVSLAQVDPLALIALRETGGCNVTVPEWLFDMDYPGHLRRRIKSVSITIPCVVGPYTGVNCTLSLTNHGTRVKGDVGGDYGDPLAAPDDRFFKGSVPIQSIATSTAQNDAGVFELNFNDERYLPFEGAGAVSEWRIDLPKESNHFDLGTISDVVLHIRYTAEAGSTALANAARANLASVLPTSGVRLFSLTQEFATAWHRFLTPGAGVDQELVFSLGVGHLPFYARGKTVNLAGLELFLGSDHNGNFDVELTLPGALAPTQEIAAPDAGLNDVHHLVKGVIPPNTSVVGTWRMKVKRDDAADFRSLQASDIAGAFLVVKFGVT